MVADFHFDQQVGLFQIDGQFRMVADDHFREIPFHFVGGHGKLLVRPSGPHGVGESRAGRLCHERLEDSVKPLAHNGFDGFQRRFHIEAWREGGQAWNGRQNVPHELDIFRREMRLVFRQEEKPPVFVEYFQFADG